MSDGAGGIFAIIIIVVGAALDGLIVHPFFMQAASTSSTAGWDPATYFMFFDALPFVGSCAIVAAVIGALLRG